MKEQNLNPETRTKAFFGQNVDVLTEQLQRRYIVMVGTHKVVQLTKLEAWVKQNVGKRYQAMENMQPGDLWAVLFPLRKMRQSLIAAQDKGEMGACIRVIRASSFSAEKGTFVPFEREGDTANYLGMGDNERGRLRFLDSSDVLYIVKEGQSVESITPVDFTKPDQKGLFESMSTKEATKELKSLIE